MTSQHLLQVGKSAVAATDHVANAAPVSEHVLISGAFGRRAPLHEYINESPSRNWSVRAVAGMVTALAWAATGIAQTKHNNLKLVNWVFTVIFIAFFNLFFVYQFISCANFKTISCEKYFREPVFKILTKLLHLCLELKEFQSITWEQKNGKHRS